MEFAKLEHSALESIKEEKMTFYGFKSALRSIFKDEEMVAEFTRDAFTLDSMWKRMSSYWNFINPTLFQQAISTHFGNIALRSNLGQYLEKLMKFQCDTCLFEFIECYSKLSTQLPDGQYDELAVQLTPYHELYLEDVDEIAEKLAELFALPKFTLQLRDFESGSSNTIVWAIPVKMAPSLKESIIDMSTIQLDHQITAIRIAGKQNKAYWF